MPDNKEKNEKMAAMEAEVIKKSHDGKCRHGECNCGCGNGKKCLTIVSIVLGVCLAVSLGFNIYFLVSRSNTERRHNIETNLTRPGYDRSQQRPSDSSNGSSRHKSRNNSNDKNDGSSSDSKSDSSDDTTNKG